MRKVTQLVDVSDVLGGMGLFFLAVGVGLYDGRLMLIVLGAACLLVAVAYARGEEPPPAAPTENEG